LRSGAFVRSRAGWNYANFYNPNFVALQHELCGAAKFFDAWKGDAIHHKSMWRELSCIKGGFRRPDMIKFLFIVWGATF